MLTATSRCGRPSLVNVHAEFVPVKLVQGHPDGRKAVHDEDDDNSNWRGHSFLV